MIGECKFYACVFIICQNVVNKMLIIAAVMILFLTFLQP
jgi:hypothetical protein